MFFKAGRGKSRTCWYYRQIIKRNDWLDIVDLAKWSDDVIYLDVRNIPFLRIDCDKITGEFRIFR